MLTLQGDGRFGSRRAFLRVGSLTLGGLALGDLLKASAAADPAVVHDKSVVFLFMHGGPSQYETFDPKMAAPDSIRSATGEIPTVIPGLTFGSTFKQLAGLAQKVSIVRSFVTGDGNHDIKPIVGRDTFGASLGAICSRVVGPNDPVTALPTNAALYPQAVDPSTRPTTKAFGEFAATGSIGGAFAPFVPGAKGQLVRDMTLSIDQARLDDRRQLLGGLDRVKRWLDSSTADGLDRMRHQALQIITSDISKAFDLSKEDPRTVDRYDTAPLVRPDAISKKWNNYNNYVDNAKSLGKLLLLARRLCERGCRFVTITTNFVWDMHADVNNAGVAEGMGYMGVPFDHAVAAFLRDLEVRGLSEKILLVCCGEMGRTPKLNGKGGRDHWGRLAPLLVAGGGLPMGQVIGQSSRDGGEPNSQPWAIKNLIGTIMHTMFDVGQLRIVPGIPREIAAMADYEPIGGLTALTRFR